MMAENGSAPIMGQYPVTLDEKGRLMFPARLRANLQEAAVVITRGENNCLWIFTKGDWLSYSEKLLQDVKDDPKLSLKKQRQHISPAMEVTIDRSGRLAVPQNLRSISGLVKEGLVGPVTLGAVQVLELWDTGAFNAFVASDD